MVEPKRVLQIIGKVCGGGVEAVIMNYYRYINTKNVQFDFVVEGDIPEYFYEEVNLRGGRVYSVTPYEQNIIAYMKGIYDIVRNQQYKIVHSNMNAMSLFSLLPAYMAGATQRIVHNHSTAHTSEGKRYIIKNILKHTASWFATEYFACSTLAARWMFGSENINKGLVTIIQNAISYEKFSFSKSMRDKLRYELGLNHKFVLAFVGRLEQQKNPIYLIYILQKLLPLIPEAHLVIIGEGSLRSELEKEIANANLQDYVTFLGLRRDTHDLYNMMDGLLLPSFYEGLGVVCIEAQVNGVPVIASLAIPEETNIRESHFFHCSLDNIQEWVQAIQEVYHMERVAYSLEEFKKQGMEISVETAKLEDLYG